MVKIFVLIIMLFIVISLGTGLYALLKGQGHQRRLVQSLTLRIVLSLGLFAMLWLAHFTGIVSFRGDPVPGVPAAAVEANGP
ncbi:MAG: twin transmembrane helix small protein [Candidatus Competibacterales bacterium]